MGEGSISTSWALLLPALDSGSTPALRGASPQPASFRTPSAAFLRLWAGEHSASSLCTVLLRPILVTPERPAVAPVTLLSAGTSASPCSL